jgi:hypothetical protein
MTQGPRNNLTGDLRFMTAMERTIEILRLLEKGARREALGRYRQLLDEMGGPGSAGEEDPIAGINRCLDVWEQISVFAAEVDRRPENARSWKLLGLAYARGGVYVTPLLKLAEHAFEAALVREEDPVVRSNIAEKVELVRAAAAGDDGSLVALIEGEGILVEPTEFLPEEVPVPGLFVQAGIINKRAVPVDTNTIAAGLLNR